MKTEFLRWCEEVSLPVDLPTVELRYAAVEATANGVTREELEGLIRVAFDAKKTPTATASLRTKLAGQGDALLDQEFKLFAAATLARILQNKDQDAALAATMIVTTSLGGFRKLKQPMDLIGMAQSARTAFALSTRHRPQLKLSPIPELTVDATNAAELEDTGDGFMVLATAFTDVIRTLAQRQAEFEHRALSYISIQDEELNMLWWLQGGRSGDLNVPFAQIQREQRPFVLAQELAEITYAIPGPSAIEALLAQACVDDDEPIAISAAVQALPLDWLKTAVPDDLSGKTSSVTTPLHDAFKRRLEVEGANSWVANWAGACGVDSVAALSPRRLADLCYCERLIIRK
nr:GTPase-associated system all-helical protein GASH [uncultured Rhodoferax sp.]